MLKQYTLNLNWSLGTRLLAMCYLVGMLIIVLAPATYAEGPEPADIEPCESCHSAEGTAWMESIHALVPEGSDAPGATCEDCHGPYVKGHPDDGVVTLRVDSSLCQDCHADTFTQWEGTIHAEANVQCISCHQSHSQELRLTDETLCRACHKESLTDSFHAAHWYVEASCTDCHMSESTLPGALAMTDAQGVVGTASHDFTTVSSDNCLTCHRGDVENPAERLDVQQLALADLRVQSERVAELDTSLEAAKRTTYSLQVMTPVMLGFGLGIGGMLGIIFMLAVSRLSRKRGEK